MHSDDPVERGKMIIDFDQHLEQAVAHYEGRYEHIIYQAPALYRLLLHLLDDPNLPGRYRPLVISALAYFYLPVDIIPEDLGGPGGLVDDVYLAAFILDYLRRNLGSTEILTSNWDGKTPLLPLIDEILAKEETLIDDKRDLILWYIGFEHLVAPTA